MSRRWRWAVIVLAVVGACSSKPGSTDPFQMFNDISTCDNVGGRGIATGTIENTGTETTTYRLEMEFTASDTGEVRGSGVVVVREVAPGDNADWTIEADGVGDGDLICATKAVSAGG